MNKKIIFYTILSSFLIFPHGTFTQKQYSAQNPKTTADEIAELTAKRDALKVKLAEQKTKKAQSPIINQQTTPIIPIKQEIPTENLAIAFTKNPKKLKKFFHYLSTHSDEIPHIKAILSIQIKKTDSYETIKKAVEEKIKAEYLIDLSKPAPDTLNATMIIEQEENLFRYKNDKKRRNEDPEKRYERYLEIKKEHPLIGDPIRQNYTDFSEEAVAIILYENEQEIEKYYDLVKSVDIYIQLLLNDPAKNELLSLLTTLEKESNKKNMLETVIETIESNIKKLNTEMITGTESYKNYLRFLELKQHGIVNDKAVALGKKIYQKVTEKFDSDAGMNTYAQYIIDLAEWIRDEHKRKLTLDLLKNPNVDKNYFGNSEADMEFLESTQSLLSRQFGPDLNVLIETINSYSNNLEFQKKFINDYIAYITRVMPSLED